jgi:hypothetical protein
LADASVRLTEIVTGSLPVRMRPVWTDEHGTFDIGGIAAGVQHLLSVQHEASIGPGGGPIYEPYLDTLPAFTAGEMAEVDVEVRRRAPCSVSAL